MTSQLTTGILLLLLTATPSSSTNALRINPLGSRTPAVQAISAALGITTPNFADEKSTWATSFQRTDAAGDLWDVQLPRVIVRNRYDAAESARLFIERFGADEEKEEEAWKLNARRVSFAGVVAERRQFAAYLKLQHCGKDDTCTQFELNYNADGCQYAPYTEWIEVFYSTNAAFVTWKHKDCTGGHALWANTCNAGKQDVHDNTPKTDSFTYVVGCTYPV